MKTSAILLVFASIAAAAHSASMRYEMNLIDNEQNQNGAELQVMPSSTTEGSMRGTMQEEAAQMNFQSNRMDTMENPTANSQQSDPGQFPTAYPMEDRYVTGSPTAQDQTFTTDDGLFQSQQRMTPSTMSSTEVHTQSHMSSFAAQQQLFTESQLQAEQQGFPASGQQSNNAQQRFFSEDKPVNQGEGQMFDGGDFTRNQQTYFPDRQQAQENRQFSENRPQDFPVTPADNKQKFSGVATTKAYTQGVNSEVRLSAFDNREHPLVIPRLSHPRSAVFVSGLKNLPSLPALVYNSGSYSAYTPVHAVTSSAAVLTPAHAVPYGHSPLYNGGSPSGHHLQTQYASVKQQVQTPYASVQQHLQIPYASVKQHFETPHVRYVYSTLL